MNNDAVRYAVVIEKAGPNYSLARRIFQGSSPPVPHRRPPRATCGRRSLSICANSVRRVSRSPRPQWEPPTSPPADQLDLAEAIRVGDGSQPAGGGRMGV